MDILFAKGLMHDCGSFAVYVQFTEENLMLTSKGLRYKHGNYWYLIDDNTEFVF